MPTNRRFGEHRKRVGVCELVLQAMEFLICIKAASIIFILFGRKYRFRRKKNLHSFSCAHQ